MTLDEFNSLSDGRAVEELMKVCGSREWAREVEEARPFETLEEAIACCDEAWAGLSRQGRLEAFAAHPRIGDKSGSSWSREEQKGVTDDEIIARLRAKNQQYEARFGHVFLICATGKSAPQILEALNTRLSNPPEKEFEIACGEQAKIMRLRMEKLVKQ